MSPILGKHSYPLSLDLNRAKQSLASLCRHPPLDRIIQALGSDGEVYIVGGAVRDTLLGKGNFDIDLATKLPPHEVERRLSHSSIRTIPTGISHGTISAHIDGVNTEITTFRRSGPRGSPAQFAETIEEDLHGRDFTINAIAYSPDTAILLDPLGGIKDLAEGRVTAVGDARERFTEDPLRLMRAVRFGPAMGRTVDESTASACRDLARLLAEVSPERIRDELCKILLSPHPGWGMKGLHELGLLSEVIPELAPSVGFEQNDFHRFDVFEHTSHVVDNAPADLVLRLAALFHDCGKPHTLTVDDEGRRHFYKHEIVSATLTREALSRLRFPHKTIGDVISLVRHHMRPMDVGKPGLRRLLRDLGDLLESWITLKRADSLAAKVTEAQFDAAERKFRDLLTEERVRDEKQSAFKLAISGEDLIKECGLKEGPALGSVLAMLREAVLDDPSVNTKEGLFALVRGSSLLEK